MFFFVKSLFPLENQILVLYHDNLEMKYNEKRGYLEF